MAKPAPQSLPPPPTKVWADYVRWVLTTVVCATLAYTWLVPEREPQEDDVPKKGHLLIRGIRPMETVPGGVVVIHFSGEEPDRGPVTASVDKDEVQILEHHPGALVVRLPEDLEEGRSKLRVHQGKAKSKGRDVWLRPLNVGAVLRDVLGGLALFILGLRTLSRSIRTYSGNRLRFVLTRLTRRGWRSALTGALTGGVTQSNVSAAGIVVGLLGSNLLPVTQALAVVLGAQVGAATMALVLPFGSRGAILVVALGVFWLALATERRARTLGKALLGLGLLFYGLDILRDGFHPLVADPALVQHLALMTTSPLHQALGALFGALATALLQGPGPVFLLVLGLTEASEALGVTQGLALLAGVPLGAAVATALVAWPFGGAPRRLALGHLVVGCALTAVLALTPALWTSVADLIVPGDPDTFVYGKHVLQPVTGLHLAAGFLISQTAAVGVAVLLLPRLSSWLEPSRKRPSSLSTGGSLTDASGWSSDAVIALNNFDQSVLQLREMLVTGERFHAADSELSLRAASAALDNLMKAARSPKGEHASLAFSVSLALTTVHQCLFTLQRQVEQTIEQDIRPSSWDQRALEQVHVLVRESLDAVCHAVANPTTIDVDAARQREIWLNARDARARRALESKRNGQALNYSKHLTLVFSAYEELGNSLFRAYELLSGELDED